MFEIRISRGSHRCGYGEPLASKRGRPPAYYEDQVNNMQKRVSINDLSKRSGTRFEINEMLAKERSDHAAAICGGDLNDVPATMLMPLSSRTTFMEFK